MARSNIETMLILLLELNYIKKNRYNLMFVMQLKHPFEDTINAKHLLRVTCVVFVLGEQHR